MVGGTPHVQVVNRYIVGAVVASEPVLSVIRRELKRLAPGSLVTTEELAQLLPDVLKRELLEGGAASQAKRRVSRASSRVLKKRATKKPVERAPSENATEDPV